MSENQPSSTVKYESVGSTENCDYLKVDPDILIVTPKPGTIDTSRMASINVEFQVKFAQDSGKRCGLVIVMTNLLSQDAESRRVYAEGMKKELFYGGAMVVENPLSRAIGSFFLGLSQTEFPMKMVNSVESGIAWIQTIRPE